MSPVTPVKALQMLADVSGRHRPPRWELRWFTLTGQPMSVRYHDRAKAQGVINAGFPATLHRVAGTL
jgi:hypothetical protein